MLTEVDLHITNRCDNNCLICSYKSGTADSNEMDFKELITVIDKLAAYGVKHIHITGGEPTLHPKIIEIVDYIECNYSDIKLRMITNGNADEHVYERLYASGLKDIMISIDGLEDNHNRIRRNPKSYKNAWRTVKKCIELGMRVRVNMVALTENISDIEESILMCVNNNVDIFSMFLFTPVGRGLEYPDFSIEPYQWERTVKDLEIFVSNNDLGKLKLIIEKGYEKKDLNAKLDSGIQGRGIGCSEIGSNKEYLIVRSNGEVYPCVFFADNNMPIANIKNDEMDQVINSEVWGYYKNIESKLSDKCISCDYETLCNGGCKGLGMSQGYDYDFRCNDEYFPVCPIMKYNLTTKKVNGSTEGVL